MSVNLPESGWQAALAIRYPEAIHENKVPDLKVDVMAADRVATTVESVADHRQIAVHNKAPIHP